jgi:hypothetical protein
MQIENQHDTRSNKWRQYRAAILRCENASLYFLLRRCAPFLRGLADLPNLVRDLTLLLRRRLPESSDHKISRCSSSLQQVANVYYFCQTICDRQWQDRDT